MKKIHIRTKQAIGMLIAVSTGLAFMLLLFSALDLDTPPAADYIRHAITDTGSINIPSAILLDYRGFDTLGEASVIFTAATVVLVILGTPRFTEPDNTLGILTRRAIAYLLPLFLVFPVYVVLNGHLSPGGGFQGGVSLSVLVILLHITYGSRFTSQRISMRLLGISEYLSAIAFISVGIVGIAQGSMYLSNAAAGIPLGSPGSLLSAGLIPVINIIVGCKVASGLSSIFYALSAYDSNTPDGTP